jgi:hypothetical protein
MEMARLVTEQAAEPELIPQEMSFGPSTTVNMAIEAWRENGWKDLSPNTTRRYRSIWTIHIRGIIGRRKIASLSPYDVELYLRGLKKDGLSEASVRQTRAILHRACRLAQKWSGNVLPNPMSGTEMPDWVLHEQPGGSCAQHGGGASVIRYLEDIRSPFARFRRRDCLDGNAAR